MMFRITLGRALLGLTAGGLLLAAPLAAQEVNSHSLAQNGWFSDDTRADGTGSESAGTNLISDTLTDDPEGTASGTSAHNADILNQIRFMPAPGTVPAGTHGGAVNLRIGASGSGKSQISHRKDDGTGHFPGSAFGPGFMAEYSWMGDGTVSVTASLKFGIKTAEYGSTSPSSRTGENAWDKVLIYEPGNLNGGTSDGAWHTESVSHTAGRWWFFDRTAGAGSIGMPMTLEDMAVSGAVFSGSKTLADVYALITAPGAHVTSVQFGIGSGNAGGSVYVNQLMTNAYRAGMTTTFGCNEPFYANGFETDTFGWNVFSSPTFGMARVASGTNGVTSADGGWHGETTASAAGNWGGYSGICGCASTTCASTADVFPLGGYTTSIDIWLDVDGGYANDSRFDFSSAVNNTTGAHRRDFIFNGAFLDSTDPYALGAGSNRFILAASNNSPGFPQGGVDPIAITESGWYTFEHRFYDSGTGVLACDFVILDDSGDELVTWTRSTPSDVIGSTVGGNRYGWFVTNELGFIAFDNAGRRPGNFDQDVIPDAIFGSGNANGSFTVDRQDGVEIGLRGKLRFPPSNIFMSNGDGSYTFSTTDVGDAHFPNPEFAFEWSVNTDYDDSTGLFFGDLEYQIGVDYDPSAATNYLVWDVGNAPTTIPNGTPINQAFWDHSFGTNATGNGMGMEATDLATFNALKAANNVAQQSWRHTFFDGPLFPFDATAAGRYDVYLAAFDGNGDEVARSAIALFAMDGATLSLEAEPCQQDQDPGTPGVQVVTELWLRNPDDAEFTGYQAFLAFDDGTMDFLGAESSYNASGSFVNHIQPMATAEVAPGELRLDGLTDFMAASGATGDELLATLVFTVTECSSPSVAFDLGQPFFSELSFMGSPETTALIDGPTILPDDTAPVISGVPADITQSADAGSCTEAVVTFAMPSATDNCDPSPTVEVSPPSGSTFPVGTTTVTITATDDCGNESVETFDVTVTATNTIDVTVQLPGSDPTTRCILFVTDCGAMTSTTLSFTGSPATATATITVPCGAFSSLCAKDEQHTLWDSTTLINGGAGYTTGSTLVLEGGDTDNDADVDINDVTFFLAQFGDPAASGGCDWDGTRDADFSNNGAVGAEDYSFLTANWLSISSCTCAAPLVNGNGRGVQVRARVFDNLSRAADFDRDGWVDVRDVELFEERFGLSGELSARMRATAR